MADQVAEVAALFDGLARDYDQSGADFFALIARGLVDRLDVRPGDRVLELGAGRGAATLPLAEAVGREGGVDALDVSAEMVRLLRRDVADLPQVHVVQGDAGDPRPPHAAYDVIASSMVVFFLPEPSVALARWRALLREDGRVGIATLRPWRDQWLALEELIAEYTGRDDADDDLWASDAGVEDLLRQAGLGEVRTEVATLVTTFDDFADWRAWARGTTARALWTASPAETHPEIERRVTEVLESARRADGRIALELDARYTVGRA